MFLLYLCIDPLNDWTELYKTIKSLNLGTMSKIRRSFSASEKLSIINEADQFGVTVTLRKHNLSPTVFRRWKENFNEGGVAKLQSYAKLRNPEVDALEEQIRVLKNIVAKQQIELEFKTELLKKSQSPEHRRSR